jgi:glutamate-1-semialdehyde 2,1-aminomutase
MGQDMPSLQSQISKQFYEEATNLMPGGVNSPVRACKALKMTPLVVDEAHGPYIVDVDGISRIDYCLSWGAIILGHADENISKSIKTQLSRGSSYGALCVQEITLARTLIEHLPHIEKLRFVSSGTEATMSAIRLARGFTSRPYIVKFTGNYHGHHDALLINAGSYLADEPSASSLGVQNGAIKDTLVCRYNSVEDIKALESKAHLIAAFIFEPVCGNMGVVLPNKDFIDALHDFQHHHKALLIVDEVMTGFRSNFQGATFDFGLKGDLFCYGKIIGGGLPCAFFGGKAHIMDHVAPAGGVFQAGTLSGNPLAMAAGFEVVSKLLEEDFYDILNQKADILLNPIRALIEKKNLNVTLNRYGSMFTLFFGLKKVECFEDLSAQDHDLFVTFYKYLYDRGVYLSPSSFEASFISLAHSYQDLEKTRDVICEFLEKL